MRLPLRPLTDYFDHPVKGKPRREKKNQNPPQDPSISLLALVASVRCGGKDYHPARNARARSVAERTQVNRALPIQLAAPVAKAKLDPFAMAGPTTISRSGACRSRSAEIFAVDIGEGDSRGARIARRNRLSRTAS